MFTESPHQSSLRTRRCHALAYSSAVPHIVGEIDALLNSASQNAALSFGRLNLGECSPFVEPLAKRRRCGLIHVSCPRARYRLRDKALSPCEIQTLRKIAQDTSALRSVFRFPHPLSSISRIPRSSDMTQGPVPRTSGWVATRPIDASAYLTRGGKIGHRRQAAASHRPCFQPKRWCAFAVDAIGVKIGTILFNDKHQLSQCHCSIEVAGREILKRSALPVNC